MKEAGIKGFLLLQVSFLIYSCSSVVAKFASGNEVLSFKFILFYGLEVVILGIYALLWQQVIKKYDLSIAYANKAVTLIWALLWSVILFKETLKWNQIVGVLIVIAGIYMLNTTGKSKKVSGADDGEIREVE